VSDLPDSPRGTALLHDLLVRLRLGAEGQVQVHDGECHE
jgi:hypothetical protein